MTVNKLFFCVLASLIPFIVLTQSLKLPPESGEYPGYPASGALLLKSESLIMRGIPFREELLLLYDALTASGGNREIITGNSESRSGIFTGNGYLMKNIEAPSGRYVLQNAESIVEFAESVRTYRKQTYLMLLPTSGAILQRNLPPYAGSVMVNQRQFIDDVYRTVAGAAITVDAYTPLIQRQNQYIYYRTEDNLTSLGGYYAYSAMLPRMGLGEADFSQFDIEYADTAYYGGLYREAGYAGAKPDVISLFRYSEALSARAHREFLVTHLGGGETKTYHTLFPAAAAVLGEPMDIFLGGLSPVTDIKTSSQFSAKVLVFGDKTALAYAPFLAVNCGRLTIVDLSLGAEEAASVDPADYDKIIFAYGVETFMRSGVPAQAVKLLR